MTAAAAGLRARAPEPDHRRSHQAVRRNSRMDGDWVHGWFRRFTWREKHELLKAARAFDRANKKAGEKSGPLGSIALELLEELTTMAVSFEGRVRPTLSYLATKIRRSRDTVVRCLKRLSEAGIVAWVRRIVPKEGIERWARGPQVEQTSNAYRLELPQRLRKFVRQAPPAADEAARKQAMRERIDAHIREEARDKQEVGVQAALARGKAMKAAADKMQERESDRRAQTGQNLTSTRSSIGVGLPADKS